MALKSLKPRAKIISSNAANIITRAIKTTFFSMFLAVYKPQKRAEQFMESFNLYRSHFR